VTARTLPQGHVASVLDRARDLSQPALREAVDRLTPSMTKVAGYHFGWLTADGRERGKIHGKGIRNAMALLSAQAAGAPVESGIPGGVAVELVHNFSLLHDDLMDGDRERHHQPTAWTVFGPSAAILGGVALLTLAEEVLLDLETSGGAAAAKLLTTSTARLVTGQTDDLEFESRDDVTLEECLRMAGNKTSALMSCSAAIGAVLNGAPPATVRALTDFGEHVGLAFQLVDDLLGIWGSPELTGKPVRSDLRAGKKTLPVAAALAAGGSAAEQLARMLAEDASEAPSEADGDDRYAAEADLVEKAGGRAWAGTEADRQLTLARERLTSVELEPDAVRDLTAVADYVVRRQQ
jgi:geranylgeranyl diphosphate synthase, type I